MIEYWIQLPLLRPTNNAYVYYKYLNTLRGTQVGVPTDDESSITTSNNASLGHVQMMIVIDD
jgi:hypothetical protein